MKAITVRQPWASLIAAGVKTIETRPRRTSYRGRIAIHAGLRFERRYSSQLGGFLAIPTITDPAYQGPQPCNRVTGRQRRIPRTAQTPTLFWPHTGPHARLRADKPEYSHTEHLPLGAVVASAVLTNCVPILTVFGTEHDPGPWIEVGHNQRYLSLWRGPRSCIAERHDGQLPFGDFSPGRWALLLDDIAPTTQRCPWCWGATGPAEPISTPPRLSGCPVCRGAQRCDPVPARGQLSVPWEWIPQVVAT